jgi:Bacterial type II/III secretion system short domain/Sigma-70, region 4/Domain of unknown function (DUF4177)
LALVRSAGRIRTPAVGAWLHGVALRVAQMVKRSAVRRRQRERRAACAEASTPVANATWAELQAAVHEEVGQLPATLRTALVLCDLQGKSQAEAAAELGWKPGTLTGRLSKARRQLLERLSKRGVAAGSVAAAVVAGGAEGFACAPPKLVAMVNVLSRAGIDSGSLASPPLLEFARAATEGSMTRTKLIVFAALAGGIMIMTFGTTIVPFGIAQEKQLPRADAVGPATNRGSDAGLTAGPAATSGTRSATAAWEYKYVVRQSSRLEDFQKTLSTQAASGWEYVGTETLDVADSNKKTNPGSAPILVFKRPTGAGRGMAGLTGGSGFTPLGGGNGFGGGLGGGLGNNQGFGGGSGFGGGGGGFSGTPLGTQPKKDPIKPASNATPNPGREPQIIALKQITATSLAKTLQELFNDANTRIVAEAQTNSLLIQADRTTFEALVKLVERLDVPSAKRTP